MVFMTAAFVASVLTDTLLAPKISDNWYGTIKSHFLGASATHISLHRSLDNQLNSIWNSSPDLVINWALNFSTDLLRMYY
jgi:hypothetical protein